MQSLNRKFEYTCFICQNIYILYTCGLKDSVGLVFNDC